ncbi:hypothetical protein FSC37_08585 [Piscinibacter aquaticus]|uniref:DUF2486 family protein n=1 Tax=Piscinibacter aquaticus TaxID=392597 RepID=A0A5C6U2P6_9BURK|nr:hypothetical protein FSC37_08585 [Piscinibacter aquaticus]
MTMRPPPPTRVPTLTEVVALPESPPAATVVAPPPVAAVAAAPAPASVPARTLDEDELVQRVLADVQRQVELMLEVKLREALAPVLTRATDALMREARNELASTLREVVARAVAQEMARHRGR